VHDVLTNMVLITESSPDNQLCSKTCTGYIKHLPFFLLGLSFFYGYVCGHCHVGIVPLRRLMYFTQKLYISKASTPVDIYTQTLHMYVPC